MRVLLTLLTICLFCGINQCCAYDLILPKEKKSIVNTNYAFFVGKAKNTEVIKINDEKIHIASNGAFAHSVKLKNGENRIVVKSNFATHVYKFYKNPSDSAVKPELVEFEPQYYIVESNNTPLRSSPVDYGMNRISHLFKDTALIVDGSQGDFYRVKLSKNKKAWIMKSAVEKFDCKYFKPEFISMNSQSFKNASVHNLEFTENLPYTIEENNKEIVFRVYNPFISEDSVYNLNIKKPDKYYYKTELFNGKYTFKLNRLNSETTVIVDPGHGGSEFGAIGCLGDKEKDINLKIALELKDILLSKGINTILTRECDANVSLNDRIKIANENGGNIFVSIHLNSIPDIKMDIHKNRGTSVYYYNSNSKELANAVMATLTKTLSTRNDGVRTASFAVIRPTDYIGILIETAYMTNPLDSVMYRSENFAHNVAEAIANGILTFIENE